MTVELVRSSAHDSDVIFAARVSTEGDKTLAQAEADPDALDQSDESEAEKKQAKRDRGLINYLMRDRHGSPFEHNSMTFYVQAPIFVFREFMRHRIASYNEESGRYKELDPVFYVPGPERNLIQVGKPGAYEFHPGSPEQFELVQAEARRSSTDAYASYQRMLKAGVAREVARIVLPLSIYSSMYVTMNARALMNFLSLRTTGYEGVETTYPSFPQREIEMCAEKIEAEWAQLMPMTHATFNANGRVAP
jgi:thymidylate synthase (FAD)